MCDLNYTLFYVDIPPYSELISMEDAEIIHTKNEFHKAGAVMHAFEAYYEVLQFNILVSFISSELVLTVYNIFQGR